ncbi:YybH family protein [Shewanella sp.]|uniref:YybH family protein n=1 Tax=Shewanella sp. TaxID=50422 RepID=UPI004054015B
MKNNNLHRLVTGLIITFFLSQSQLVLAHGDEQHTSEARLFVGQELAPAKVVKQFHQALRTGDTKGVSLALASDVLIYEGGNAERSLAEYTSHHMQADMIYLKGLTVTTKEQQVRIIGDMAISTAISHSTGTYKDKKIDSTGMETLVLAMQGDGSWKIIHIHWS